MEDSSLIYFTQDDIISKIDIDPRLVDSFKRVMKRLQEYFNEKGYIKDRDYKDYLERNLLGKYKLKICIEDDMSDGLGGYYNKYESKIAINGKNLAEKNYILDSTLCHEFIHFLVMHELKYGEADEAIINGGFVNEALTESLTQDIYSDGNANAYKAQVAMHKFANKISGNTNNYRLFLKGQIDAKLTSSMWMHYLDSCEKYQDEFDEKGYLTLEESFHNQNYISAQRALINLFTRTHDLNTFEEFFEDISKIVFRPVRDDDYVNSHIDTMIQGLVRKLCIYDNNLKEVLSNKLRESVELIKQSITKGHYFEFAGKRLSIDEDLNIISYDGLLRDFFSVTSPNKDRMSLSHGNESIELNKDEFILDKTKVNNSLIQISKYFTKEYTSNYSFINNALEQEGNLLKIEKFKLPNLGVYNSNQFVYVATYDNKIVVLNKHYRVDELNNINMKEYLDASNIEAFTSGIYEKQLGTINKGIVYSTRNKNLLENEAKFIYANDIKDSLSEEEIEQAIIDYKNSGECFTTSKRLIRNEAIEYLCESKFEMLSDDVKQVYMDKANSKTLKYIVTMNNGIVDVGVKHNNSAYISNREVLYDVNSNVNYNDLVNELKKYDIKKNNIESIEIDPNGNIMNKDNEYISKIEELLNIVITPVSRTTTINNYPKLVLKNNLELLDEQREIIRRLNHLRVNNKITVEEYDLYKNIIMNEYNTMILKAPKIEVEEQVSQKTM